MSKDFLSPIPIFIGYDFRERAAANTLIDSLYQNSSVPLAITPLVTSQLISQKIYYRERDEKQSTDFSFSRFLVPFLMGYKGWAIFMDCDMLCFSDIKGLWEKRNDEFAVMCVKHNHVPGEKIKFLGEIQSKYQKKNWSSMMLLNCERCKSLTVEYVNTASGLELHRFNWLKSENEIGSLSIDWNFLVGVNKLSEEKNKFFNLIHWTLGGPWFDKNRDANNPLSEIWFKARNDAMELWNDK